MTLTYNDTSQDVLVADSVVAPYVKVMLLRKVNTTSEVYQSGLILTPAVPSATFTLTDDGLYSILMLQLPTTNTLDYYVVGTTIYYHVVGSPDAPVEKTMAELLILEGNVDYTQALARLVNRYNMYLTFIQISEQVLSEMLAGRPVAKSVELRDILDMTLYSTEYLVSVDLLEEAQALLEKALPFSTNAVTYCNNAQFV